jgi:hypothetical protein
MFDLSTDQLNLLAAEDRSRFIHGVAALFLAQLQAREPDAVVAPEMRDLVLDRMSNAHRFAVDIGFTSSPDIVQLMFLATHAPQLCTDPVVSVQLRKSGATPEQRFADILAVAESKLREAH